MSSLPALLGLGLLIAGFVLKLHPLRVVALAMCAAALSAGLEIFQLLALIGEAFRKNRFLILFVLVLPMIGLLEQRGLREQSAALVGKLKGLTASRLLISYLALRQGAAALGLTSLGGQAQTVRPLLVPMAEAAAQRATTQSTALQSTARQSATSSSTTASATTAPANTTQPQQELRALCAATDNVGLFFGEDVFVAFGAVLLMQGFLADNGIIVDALHIALWGIPTALCAFAIHAARLTRLRTPYVNPAERST